MQRALRNWICSAAIVALAMTSTSAQEKKEYPTLGKITRLDPRFDKLVPETARIERLAEGFDWSEGPVWVKEGGYLLFSDIPKNSVMSWLATTPVGLLG